MHTLQCTPVVGSGCSLAQTAGGIVIGTNGGGVANSGTLTAYDAIAWTGAGTTPSERQRTPLPLIRERHDHCDVLSAEKYQCGREHRCRECL